MRVVGSRREEVGGVAPPAGCAAPTTIVNHPQAALRAEPDEKELKEEQEERMRPCMETVSSRGHLRSAGHLHQRGGDLRTAVTLTSWNLKSRTCEIFSREENIHEERRESRGCGERATD